MGLRRHAKVELIRSSPLFARCSRADVAHIASIADELDIADGKKLTREGERGREFFVLVEGEVQVTREGKPLRTMGPGDFLGEIALLARVPRTATAVAVGPVRTLVVREQQFRRLLLHSPRIQLKVLQALAERVGAGSV